MPAALSYRAQTLAIIDGLRRDRGLDYHQLGELAKLSRHQVVRALVGVPEETDFPTLLALANAVQLDLARTGVSDRLSAASA